MGHGAMIVKRNVKRYLLSVSHFVLSLTVLITKETIKHVQKKFGKKHSSVGFAVAVHENMTLGQQTMLSLPTPRAFSFQRTEVATHHGAIELTRLASHGN
jgi:hypothetical protein